jgi:hypothetical protein
MQLKYYVPFKAQIGQEADLALKEKLLNIEGVAIDTSVNSNKWQVPPEDLDFFVSTLQGSQLRIDHAESAMAVIGKVPEATKKGDTAWFKGEIGDLAIIEKVLRGYLTHVSVQVDSDEVECSNCGKATRKEGMLIHLCPGAWEVVHKPKVRELSIVASPAYKNTEFKPLGFASAMNEGQEKARVEFQRKDLVKKLLASRLALASLRSSENDEDVGSRLKEPQGPENKHEKEEVKPLSAQQTGQQEASPHQAQGVVNVAPGEGAPKQVTYDELTNQVTKLMDQLKTAGTDAEIEALGKKVAEIEAEVAKRATKKGLTQKLNELSRKMSESAADAADAESAKKGKKGEGAGDGEAEDLPGSPSKKAPDQAETAESAKQKVLGKGLISNEELDREQNGPTAPWFKDLLKANALMNKGGRSTFSG